MLPPPRVHCSGIECVCSVITHLGEFDLFVLAFGLGFSGFIIALMTMFWTSMMVRLVDLFVDFSEVLCLDLFGLFDPVPLSSSSLEGRYQDPVILSLI